MSDDTYPNGWKKDDKAAWDQAHEEFPDDAVAARTRYKELRRTAPVNRSVQKERVRQPAPPTPAGRHLKSEERWRSAGLILLSLLAIVFWGWFGVCIVIAVGLWRSFKEMS
jgi:hypothetical protein